ncbi:hypothetical protein CFE70_001613 [Pyrenophora teres f. teres 0-1]
MPASIAGLVIIKAGVRQISNIKKRTILEEPGPESKQPVAKRLKAKTVNQSGPLTDMAKQISQLREMLAFRDEQLEYYKEQIQQLKQDAELLRCQGGADNMQNAVAVETTKSSATTSVPTGSLQNLAVQENEREKEKENAYIKARSSEDATEQSMGM